MAPTSKKTPIGVNLCSVCDEARVCFGEQKRGGIRYCGDCIKETLAWVQLGDEAKKNLQAVFKVAADHPVMKAELKKLGKLSKEEREAYAIGESRRRLLEER